MRLKTLRKIRSLVGRRVLVRVDFNVPLGKRGEVKNDKRLRLSLPTLRFLLKGRAKQIVLMCHVGRPKDREPHLRTDRIASCLSKLLRRTVAKVDGWGEKGLPAAPIVLLENLRFHPGEKSKDQKERLAFGKQLASLADLYVNDAFSNSHRAHASMVDVPKFLPAVAGLGLEHEVRALAQALHKPKRPLVALLGGLKADKLEAVANLMGLADQVMVAGALAFNLLHSKGYSMGASIIDAEGLEGLRGLVRKILRQKNVFLPQDAVVADRFSEKARRKIVPVEAIPRGWMALDLGPETLKRYTELIRKAKTVLWFGPVGVFEWRPFAKGTRALAKAVAANRGLKVVGGGDSAAAVETLGLASKMTLVSSGGGASLAMIEGKPMPGLEPLMGK